MHVQPPVTQVTHVCAAQVGKLKGNDVVVQSVLVMY